MIRRNLFLVVSLFLFLFYGCLKNSSKSSSVIENKDGTCWFVYPVSSSNEAGYCSITCTSCPNETNITEFNRDFSVNKMNNKIKRELCPLITEGEKKNVKYIAKTLSSLGLDYNKDYYLNMKEDTNLENEIKAGFSSISAENLKEDKENIEKCTAAYKTSVPVVVRSTEEDDTTLAYGVLKKRDYYSTVQGFLVGEPELLWKSLPISGSLTFATVKRSIPSGYRLPTSEECKYAKTFVKAYKKYCMVTVGGTTTTTCYGFHVPPDNRFWLSTPVEYSKKNENPESKEYYNYYTCDPNGILLKSQEDIDMKSFIVVKEYSETDFPTRNYNLERFPR